MASLTGQGMPNLRAQVDDRAVHVIDLGLAALHQVLPHRRDRPRAGEDAIDQRDEVLVEADAIGRGDREALIDDLLLQRIQLRIDDAHRPRSRSTPWSD